MAATKKEYSEFITFCLKNKILTMDSFDKSTRSPLITDEKVRDESLWFGLELIALKGVYLDFDYHFSKNNKYRYVYVFFYSNQPRAYTRLTLEDIFSMTNDQLLLDAILFNLNFFNDDVPVDILKEQNDYIERL